MPKTKKARSRGSNRGGSTRARSKPDAEPRPRGKGDRAGNIDVDETIPRTQPGNPDARTDTQIPPPPALGDLSPDDQVHEGARPEENLSTRGVDAMGVQSPATWDYQPDPNVLDVLQETADQGNPTDLAGELKDYTAESPRLSAQDVDADWQRAEAVGEEAVGGTVATPDQDRVDDIGAALGIVYQDEEPLKTEDKLKKRDRKRWELDIASKETMPEQQG